MVLDQRTVSAAPAGALQSAVRLSTALAVVAFVASALTFAAGDVLTGPPVMNGSARGTSLMMSLVGAPALFLAGRQVLRGSTRAVLVWAGMSMFLTYNSFMLLTASPVNRLFLLYVASFGLSLATMISIGRSIDAAVLARRCDSTLPVRGVAVYLWVIVALNALAWLGRVVPATIDDRMSDLTKGMGIATVPTYLQDLAFWLPLIAVGAWLLWRRQAWGYLVSGAALAFWALEGATVAVDQWFGHRADPMSDVASDAMVLPFAILAAIGAVMLWSFLRHVTPEHPARQHAEKPPTSPVRDR